MDNMFGETPCSGATGICKLLVTAGFLYFLVRLPRVQGPPPPPGSLHQAGRPTSGRFLHNITWESKERSIRPMAGPFLEGL